MVLMCDLVDSDSVPDDADPDDSIDYVEPDDSVDESDIEPIQWRQLPYPLPF